MGLDLRAEGEVVQPNVGSVRMKKVERRRGLVLASVNRATPLNEERQGLLVLWICCNFG